MKQRERELEDELIVSWENVPWIQLCFLCWDPDTNEEQNKRY